MHSLEIRTRFFICFCRFLNILTLEGLISCSGWGNRALEAGGTGGWPAAGGTLGGDELYKEKRREPAWPAAARALARGHEYLRKRVRTLLGKPS